ncbi:MAG: WG repeat-containing protein, partial [Oscillospiraceae bacterium]
MNYKIKLIAMFVALMLTFTACGNPSGESSVSTVPSSGAAAPKAPTTEVSTPEASSTAPAVDVGKPVTGFSLAIPMQYDMVTSFSDGLALVGTNVGENLGDAESPYYAQKYSYIDASGKVVLELDPTFS